MIIKDLLQQSEGVALCDLITHIATDAVLCVLVHVRSALRGVG
jgi:hypothetical protein